MYDIIIEQLAPKGYLRAAINLSNFLLVTGTDDQGNPEGVSPDLAKALANELNIEYKLIPFKRPGELADAVTDDVWDIGNIANESERAKSITFSHPYTLIESTFLVRESSEINSLQDVDKKDVRIAVAERSAYDLWLTENIKNAELIRAKSIDLSFKIFEDNHIREECGKWHDAYANFDRHSKDVQIINIKNNGLTTLKYKIIKESILKPNVKIIGPTSSKSLLVLFSLSYSSLTVADKPNRYLIFFCKPLI